MGRGRLRVADSESPIQSTWKRGRFRVRRLKYPKNRDFWKTIDLFF